MAPRSEHLTRQRINFAYSFDFIAEKFNAHRIFRCCNGENFKHISVHAELSAHKVYVVSFILHFNKARNRFVAVFAHPGAQRQHKCFIILRVTETVYAADRSNNDNVAPLKQGACRTVAQLVDFIVNLRVFFYICVARRNICLRLIVIIIAYKIFNGVFGKELLELRAKLRRQNFVVCKHERGLVNARNRICNRKRFSASRNAQKRLPALAALYSAHKALNCLGLIACRLVIRNKFKIHSHRLRSYLIYYIPFCKLFQPFAAFFIRFFAVGSPGGKTSGVSDCRKSRSTTSKL